MKRATAVAHPFRYMIVPEGLTPSKVRCGSVGCLDPRACSPAREGSGPPEDVDSTSARVVAIR
jgi:hypothetical protein